MKTIIENGINENGFKPYNKAVLNSVMSSKEGEIFRQLEWENEQFEIWMKNKEQGDLPQSEISIINCNGFVDGRILHIDFHGEHLIIAHIDDDNNQRIKIIQHKGDSYEFYKWIAYRLTISFLVKGEIVDFDNGLEEEKKMTHHRDEDYKKICSYGKIIKRLYHDETNQELMRFHQLEGEQKFFIFCWIEDKEYWTCVDMFNFNNEPLSAENIEEIWQLEIDAFQNNYLTY
ncbi:MAG: hypothetical protein ACERKD_05935 [Prolixibacteraceae bacterium]